MQMHDQMRKAWRGARMNPAVRDFFRGCYHGLNDIGARYNDTFSFQYTYSDGKKNAAQSGKTYCILTLSPGVYGTFETWLPIAYMAMIALADGYVPVVDLRGYRRNLAKENWGKFTEETTNYWDVFFRQYQQRVSLEEVYRSGDYVRFLINESYSDRTEPWGSIHPSQAVCEGYHKIYQKMGINEQILRETEKKGLPKRTLGIMVRRNMEWGNRLKTPAYTGMTYIHARGSLQAYERWIDENLHRLGFDYFLIAADDRSTVEYLQEKFSDSCICVDRKLTRKFDGDRPLNPEVEAERKVFYQELSDDPAVRIKETETGYISETLLLSKCAALLPNRMAQEMMARIIAEQEIPLVDNDIFLDMYSWEVSGCASIRG